MPPPATGVLGLTGGVMTTPPGLAGVTPAELTPGLLMPELLLPGAVPTPLEVPNPVEPPAVPALEPALPPAPAPAPPLPWPFAATARRAVTASVVKILIFIFAPFGMLRLKAQRVCLSYNFNQLRSGVSLT